MSVPVFQPGGQDKDLGASYRDLNDKQSELLRFLEEMNAMQVLNLEPFAARDASSIIKSRKENPEWQATISYRFQNVHLLRPYLGRDLINRALEVEHHDESAREQHFALRTEILKAIEAKVLDAGGRAIVDSEKGNCHITFEGKAAEALRKTAKAEYRYYF